MEPSNPFADFGATVTGERFIGRTSELRTLDSRIFGQSGFGSIAVVGLPRIGKTSLVSEAIRRAKPRTDGLRCVVVRADVGAFDSIDALFRSIVDELIAELRSRGLATELIASRVGRAIDAAEIGFSEVRAVFKALRQAGVRPVCVLDEFDAGRRIFEGAPKCFHWLRELCSNPEFKAAVVLVAKRRLQDVARLAGFDSDYWANVLMTLTLKPLPDADVAFFFTKLEQFNALVGVAERSEVQALCGGHPFLLDAFGYFALERVEQGRTVDVEWIRTTCGNLVRDYLQQLSTVLADGSMLSKAVQVLVGPQWDVTSDDVYAMCDFGILLQDEDGTLRGFSRAFEDYLRFMERNIDIWPLWRDTERVLREVLERQLVTTFGTLWSEALCTSRPKLRPVLEACKEKRSREQMRIGAGNAPSLLAYTYPMDLYQLMAADWTNLGEPLLGRDKNGWAGKFAVLSKVRTPLAHNRAESVSEGERIQAEGICREILDRYYTIESSA